VSDPVAVQITDALLAILAGVAGVQELAFAPPGDPNLFPALHADDEGEDILSQDWLNTRANLAFSVTGYVKGGGAETHKAARMLDAEVVTAIMASPSLGGLATFIDLGGLLIEPVQLASIRTVSFRRTFSVNFSFKTTDPTVVGG
jgi:hypothetical protein